MQFSAFLMFDGNCREALEYYKKVFNSEVKNLMTYGDAPPSPNYSIPESDKNRVMYSDIRIGEIDLMFSDVPTGDGITKGDNILLALGVDKKEEVIRIFNCLKENGKVNMDLQQTFYAELYCMVTDKFGIIWQIIYNVCKK